MPRVAFASTNTDSVRRTITPGGKHGRLLRDRLGRRPSRHRRRGPGRQAAGPPPDQRRPGRARGVAGPARRARRHRREPGPGSDRDAPRAAGRLPARHRPAGLPRQPDGGGPLPGPALGHGEEIRPRRLGRAGQRAAHRHGHAPAAARRFRAGPGHRGAGPRPAERRLGPHHRAQQAPLLPARVLPRLPGRLRRCPRRHHPARGPRRPGRRSHPGRSRRADPDPAAQHC